MNPDDPRLTAYALNELTAQQRVELETELETNLPLYGEIDEICSIGTVLERSFSEQPVPVPQMPARPAPPQERVIGMPARSQTMTGAIALLATAACVALMVYIMMNFSTPVPGQPKASRITEADPLAPIPAPAWGESVLTVEMSPDEPQPVTASTETPPKADQEKDTPALIEPAEMLLAIRKSAMDDDLPAEDRLPSLVENDYLPADSAAESDVPVLSGRASYPWVRRYLADVENGKLPPREAVRIEELVNAFPYDEPRDALAGRVASGMRLVACPWDSESWLLGVLLKNTSTMDDVEVKARLHVRGSAVDEYRLIGFAQPKTSSKIDIPRVLPAGESQFVIYQLKRKAGDLNSRQEIASLRVRSRIPGRSWDNATLACNVSDRSWLTESEDFRFAALMTAFGSALRNGDAAYRSKNLADVSKMADVLVGKSRRMTKPQREAVGLIKRASKIAASGKK